MNEQRQQKIQALMGKGVRMPNPESVDIGEEVNPDRISGDGVVIHAGCRIFGSNTLILHGAQLGYEGPVTIDNCHIGPFVELKGGFFKEAVFLKKSAMGLGAHVRGGTILEEEASGAHTVALKHTILFPFVTLGSLINFCDCFMSGGTSRKDHSEVGSAYIHFNFTPNQDKATPSLIGDVPRGVMLDQPPVFLGGQGGMVGPCCVAFGTVMAAGSICRKDQPEPGRLVMSGSLKSISVPFHPGIYRNIRRVVKNNIQYMANLSALLAWYTHVRAQFISHDFSEPLHQGLINTLCTGITERIHRLRQVSERMPESVRAYEAFAGEQASRRLLQQKNELHDRFSALEAFLKDPPGADGDPYTRDLFLENMEKKRGSHKDYIRVIQMLRSEDAMPGVCWLRGIVDGIVSGAGQILPSFELNLS